MHSKHSTSQAHTTIAIATNLLSVDGHHTCHTSPHHQAIIIIRPSLSSGIISKQKEKCRGKSFPQQMPRITNDDRERVRLLNVVAQSKDGFKRLSLEEVVRLQELLERKDYTKNKKLEKSKATLLKKINVRIYELTEGKDIWGN